jgi:hypothetical protein
MAKKKSLTPYARETAGTTIARENRAQTNGLSGSQRNTLLTQGMQLIHGLSAGAEAEVHHGAARCPHSPNAKEKLDGPIG